MENEAQAQGIGNSPPVSQPNKKGAAQSTHQTLAPEESHHGGESVAGSALLEDWAVDEEEPKSKSASAPAGEASGDPELEELLDQSLSEFGKHVPPSVTKQPPSMAPSKPKTSKTGKGVAAGPTPHAPPSPKAGDLPDMEEFEEIFSEELAVQAEAQLGEAMQMLSSENPELWQQLETFAKSMGLEEPSGFSPQPTPSFRPAAERKQAGRKEPEGQPKPAAPAPGTLDAKLEDTLTRLRASAQQIESGGNPGDLSSMLGQLDLGSEEGEDGLMKVMQGMMTTLLSREVLYPSLTDLCKQYPEWLSSHKATLSPEDYSRYSKQLDIMNTICREFEGETEGEGEEVRQARSEKIMQLMQQLQQCGQPPEDLAGETTQQAGLPGIPKLSDFQGTQNCTVM